MDETLTLADCYKYPNAKIIKHNGDKIKDVLQLIIWALTKNLLVEFALKDFNCKLILRDLSELTNEEKEYIIDNFVFDLFKDDIADKNWDSFKELYSICDNKIELADYLRSINVDIDGYIASGKAVKE